VSESDSLSGGGCMRDFENELRTVFDELDAEQKKTQLAKTPQEVEASVMKAGELFLQAQAIFLEVKNAALAGDRAAAKALSDLSPRASESIKEGVRSLAHVKKVLGADIAFRTLNPSMKH
jgi:hypothetical protein